MVYHLSVHCSLVINFQVDIFLNSILIKSSLYPPPTKLLLLSYLKCIFSSWVCSRVELLIAYSWCSFSGSLFCTVRSRTLGQTQLRCLWQDYRWCCALFSGDTLMLNISIHCFIRDSKMVTLEFYPPFLYICLNNFMYKEMLPLIYNLVTQWYSSKKGRINVWFFSFM